MPRKQSLESLRAALRRLSPEQRQEIYDWLGELIVEKEAEIEIPARSGSAISEHRHHEGMTYQLEKRRCNRSGCKCMIGEIGESGHGPYWYAYWKENGKIRSRYVGKRPPWEDLLA